MISDGGASDNTEFSLHVRVTTSDGVSTEHIYPLRGTESARLESEIDLVLENIVNALAEITPLLRLANPSVIYRAEHVVRLAYDIIEENELTVGVEERGPIGFRPS